MTSLSLGLNIASLGARRQLAQATDRIGTVFERLSSGQRINRASDDAAGLAIAESLNVDTKVYTQGIRNFNDGVSLLNIADSSLASLSNIVVRLQELAEQSANGTYGNQQRKALNEEAQALSKEYSRIIHSTKFNDISLLDGSLAGGVRLQGGYGLNGGILSGVGGAIGDGTFESPTSFQIGGSPQDITAGDLNGDGISDLVVAEFTGDSVSVLLGLGDGTFAPRVSYTVGDGSLEVKLDDFNGDGVLDIANVSRLDDTLSILLGNGNGTFQTATSYVLGSSPQSVSTGDLNGDGFTDLVVADRTDQNVTIILGNGDGTFVEGATYSIGLFPMAVTLADLNSDGVLDIAAADGNGGTLSVLLGNGDGSFGTRTSYLSGGFTQGVYAGDYNGDGNLDLIGSDSTNETLQILMGNGDGTFATAVSYVVGTNPFKIEGGDFNGDGLLDVATITVSSVDIMLGNGDGTFGAVTSYQTLSNAFGLTQGDFNGDGVSDLATAENSGQIASVFLGEVRDGAAPLLPFDLSTLVGARQALPVFDDKIEQLASQRGQIGAFQSRLEIGINNLQTSAENFSAAESRIRDVDVAEESSQLVRLNILQQAASSVLAQANQQPALVLRLLQD